MYATPKPARVVVLVCGGRDLNPSDVWNWLERNLKGELADLFKREVYVAKVVHGGASGADEGADKWGRSEEDCIVRCYKANWRKHGKAAGPIRNQLMLDEQQPHVVVAFPGGRGTADMCRRAEAAGVPVVRAKLDVQTPRLTGRAERAYETTRNWRGRRK